VPVALTVIFALTPTEKVWLLTAWLIWMVTVFVFLVVLESLRDSFERQLKLDGMSEEGLLELGASRNSMARTSDALRGLKGGGGHE
jgi:putative membrane protein